jgi:formylmethanofuran dehydrogenase subunit B
MPRTIQRVYSKWARAEYWANVCPYCGTVCSDFDLYCEEDGEFFGTAKNVRLMKQAV